MPGMGANHPMEMAPDAHAAHSRRAAFVTPAYLNGDDTSTTRAASAAGLVRRRRPQPGPMWPANLRVVALRPPQPLGASATVSQPAVAGRPISCQRCRQIAPVRNGLGTH